MSEDWQTQSPVRLAHRALIRSVIERWVHGPVELLAAEDVAELEEVLRGEFPGGTRAGYLYLCWRAEVNLALGREGDAARHLRNKVKKPGVDLRGLTPEQKKWVEEKGAKVERQPVQVQLPGRKDEFFNDQTEPKEKN